MRHDLVPLLLIMVKSAFRHGLMMLVAPEEFHLRQSVVGIIRISAVIDIAGVTSDTVIGGPWCLRFSYVADVEDFVVSHHSLTT